MYVPSYTPRTPGMPPAHYLFDPTVAVAQFHYHDIPQHARGEYNKYVHNEYGAGRKNDTNDCD